MTTSALAGLGLAWIIGTARPEWIRKTSYLFLGPGLLLAPHIGVSTWLYRGTTPYLHFEVRLDAFLFIVLATLTLFRLGYEAAEKRLQSPEIA